VKFKAASIQMISENGNYERNRLRAESLIKDAVLKKARLILIPEFALAGYIFTDDIWSIAEPLKGRTYLWLKKLCVKHKVYLGTCILEKDGDEFYDTFILAGPGKNEIWSHRKIEPAVYEAYFIRGGEGAEPVFETPLGRIGVAICFDTSKTLTIEKIAAGRPDLLLIPFSYPGLGAFMPGRDRRKWDEEFKKIPSVYAGYLGVPVVTSNKTGSFESPLPLCGPVRVKSDFTGVSQIVDASGEVLVCADKGEQVIVHELNIKPSSFSAPLKAIPSGRWLMKYSFTIRFTADLVQKMGGLRYRISRKRKIAARG